MLRLLFIGFGGIAAYLALLGYLTRDAWHQRAWYLGAAVFGGFTIGVAALAVIRWTLL